MNKTYGTTILASAGAQARCSDRILFRPVGLGQTKGRHTVIDGKNENGGPGGTRTPNQAVMSRRL
jgi:hypothetical protein